MIAEVFHRRRTDQARSCRVTLKYRGRSLQVTGLIDTGNLLYEPYGHQPVHIITASAIGELVDTVTKVIYIPYSSVGKSSGMLPGIRVDEMTVKQEGRPEQRIKEPWIAICHKPLSEEHKYEMLLHMDEI